MSPDSNLTDDQRWLLNAAYARFRDSGEWPRIDELQHALDRAEEDRDVDSIAESLDRRYGWRSRGQDEYVELTLCGVAACEGAEDDLADVLTVGRKAFSLYLVHGAGFSLSSSDVAPDLEEDGVRLRRVLILGRWLPGWGGGSSSADAWTRIITREIRRWRDVATVDAMLALASCASEGLHKDPLPEQTSAASTGVASSGEPTGRGTFSLRQHGPPAKTSELLTPAAWGGIVALVRSLLGANAFAAAYPVFCDDAPHSQVIAADEATLALAVADHTDLAWPLEPRQVPDLAFVMDLLEFLHGIAAQAGPGALHPFFDHHHLRFDPTVGRSQFIERTNALFSRHGLAFEQQSSGQIERIGSPLDHARTSELPASGDADLDQCLMRALLLYRSRDFNDRLTALRELWDCYERLKSLTRPRNKKASTQQLIRTLTGDAPLYEVVNADMSDLTAIGNQFGIRHAEVGQHAMTESAQLDYLFGRLFNVIWTLLRARAAMGPSD